MFHVIQLTPKIKFYASEMMFEKGYKIAVDKQRLGFIDATMDLSKLVLESQADYLFNVEVEGAG